MEYGVIRIVRHDAELYHHGVKGMKWGVRRSNNNVSRSGRTTKSKADDTATTSKKSSKNKTRRRISIGKRMVNTLKSKKVKRIIASTAAVTSGALWVASAVLPGAGAIVANTAAAAANMVSLAVDK